METGYFSQIFHKENESEPQISVCSTRANTVTVRKLRWNFVASKYMIGHTFELRRKREKERYENIDHPSLTHNLSICEIKTWKTTHNVTDSQLAVSWALHLYRRGHGFESRSDLNYFQDFISWQLLKLCVKLRWPIMSSVRKARRLWRFRIYCEIQRRISEDCRRYQN